ncbi:hypothetical protein AWM75_07095 [Aerococcus urinaehominis]|uniref:citrate lyase holo-[acyl-carrier protein] synthase n=1 Tax=Aerococcus urinaehominis TaxID=128944 RepID=A0A120IB07_9LACT|nr:citrate lyase holo-[acyl-carrier protein] synthase [Aerococcus urinaehominis]AMB99743.1 hypothetical protein AWM75_07095 [Aerococcus urinaehominis]SDM10656.1 holo-ACP synthase [Aerococcus urinaehominis]
MIDDYLKALASGPEVGLDQVLASREARASWQEKCLNQHPKGSLIALKLNIVGPVKNNDLIAKIFALAQADLEASLQAAGLTYQSTAMADLETGPEAFYLVNAAGNQVKKLTMELENQLPLARLYDLDVLVNHAGQVQALSRQDFGQSARSCLVCGQDAKACGRSRKHDLSIIRQAMVKLIEKDGRLANVETN